MQSNTRQDTHAWTKRSGVTGDESIVIARCLSTPGGSVSEGHPFHHAFHARNGSVVDLNQLRNHVCARHELRSRHVGGSQTRIVDHGDRYYDSPLGVSNQDAPVTDLGRMVVEAIGGSPVSVHLGNAASIFL